MSLELINLERAAALVVERGVPVHGADAVGLALHSNGQLGADLLHVPAGVEFPVLTHPGDHLLLCLAGSGTITVDGQTHAVRPGGIYLVPGKVPHAVGAGEADHVLVAIGSPHKPVDSPARSVERARALLAPVLPRTREPGEADLTAVEAPDASAVFFVRTSAGDATSWLSDFILTNTGHTSEVGLTHIDHIALAQPFDHFDEAALYYRSVLGLDPHDDGELATPFGLVRSRAVVDPDGRVRIVLHGPLLRRGRWAPAIPDPQHIAFATEDIFSSAARMRERGAPLLHVSDNYYDDLEARLELDPGLLKAMRELGLLYDRDQGGGEFLHLYTEVLGGRVFFEVVQRTRGYAGYGSANAPVRMAAHYLQRRQKSP